MAKKRAKSGKGKTALIFAAGMWVALNAPNVGQWKDWMEMNPFISGPSAQREAALESILYKAHLTREQLGLAGNQAPDLNSVEVELYRDGTHRQVYHFRGYEPGTTDDLDSSIENNDDWNKLAEQILFVYDNKINFIYKAQQR